MLIKGTKKYNFRHNTQRTEPPETGKMINGQGLGRVSQLRYGLCRMSFNGCEVIAVHNALIHLGTPVPLPEIALYMERFKVLWGIFGCNVYKIGKALAHFGAASQRTKAMDGAEAFIVSYWTGRRLMSSIHTVFCICTENGIKVYNSYNSCPDAQLLQNEEAVVGKKKPIAVYIIK